MSKKNASTQRFTEIENIYENVVLLTGGHACLIIEIEATNFALLSGEEQSYKISAYASLLNSLSFPVQIVIRNKKEDISTYLKLIDAESKKASPALAGYVSEYKSFIRDLVKDNTILDKKCYMVISFSSLELGAKGAIKHSDFPIQAQAGLNTKAQTLLSQLSRVGLSSRVLQKEELVRLFYELFNPASSSIDSTETFEDLKTPMVKGAPQK